MKKFLHFYNKKKRHHNTSEMDKQTNQKKNVQIFQLYEIIFSYFESGVKLRGKAARRKKKPPTGYVVHS
jgi:hypothetical protein